ncbi:MAG: hypothetical protein BGO51_13605 [Rhodospirillales bacterium 69-11]|nr:MAG: hypothetical protein BGO51_13605 [Rhodospirillales bacterium 69-11]
MVASIVQFDHADILFEAIQVAVEIAPIVMEHPGNWLRLQRSRRPRCVALRNSRVLTLERILGGLAGHPELLRRPFAAAA